MTITDKKKKYNREYYIKNKETILNNTREYYLKNKKKIDDRIQKWRKNNPEKVREWERKRDKQKSSSER